MRDRRTASTSLSLQVLDYLVKRGYTQADVARMLGLSQGFISLVKSRERGFTLEHLAEFSARLGVPLGAFLLATESPRQPRNAEDARFLEVTERLIRMADQVAAVAARQSAAEKTA